MNKEQLEILTNIVGAVESGGQIYGKRRYEAYAGAYANSHGEVTCTLGWAQNYGANARKLVQAIYDADKEAFLKADTAGIAKRLKQDWVAIKWNPSAKEKASLIAIITTTAGRKCQDELFQEDAKKYIQKAEAFGVTDVAAQMMWCEIEHLGGLNSVKRIFSRAAKPYTPDSIFSSLLHDQKDTSNRNQVGDAIYQSRHECCVKWIKQYVKYEDAKEEDHMGNITAEDVLGVMRSWIGLSRAKGTHKPIIDLYNSHKPLARGYKASYQDDYCDITVSAAFIKLGATDLIGGTECGVEEHVNLFQKAEIWNEDGTITPEPGDIIIYNWDDNTQPNDGYSDHIGLTEYIDKERAVIVAIEGNMDGGIVGRREIPVGHGYIRGYARPKYKSGSAENSGAGTSGTNTGGNYMFTVGVVQSGSTGNDVKLLQRLLKSNGCKGKDGKTLSIDGSAGSNTVYAIKAYQKKKGLKVDGCCGSATWGSILMR